MLVGEKDADSYVPFARLNQLFNHERVEQSMPLEYR